MQAARRRPSPAAAPACADNLLANPSFETGTTGWGGVSTEVGATYAVSAWVRSDTDPAAAVVEIYVAVEGPAAGDCFQLDDLCFIPR